VIKKKFRKQRNHCTNLRRRAVKDYFKEKCDGKSGSKDFWSTVKPFLTNKGINTQTDFTLCHDDKIITNKTEVANIFNNYYVNIAAQFGPDSSVNDEKCIIDVFSKYENHDSVKNIKEHMDPYGGQYSFKFNHVTSDYVKNQMCGLDIRKATGYDNLPPKIIKAGADILANPICYIINQCIDKSIFPDDLKNANVSPVFKKKDRLIVDNYRPVSILPTMSKIFERAMSDQIVSYFDNIFDDRLAAFRSGYSCQHVLMKLVEDWRKALDGGQIVGTILMDLSKAFDAMPHDLLLAKLNAYGWTDDAIKFMSSYLSNRRQRVKINDVYSSWLSTIKGVPQGSIIGPIAFNIFINDLFYVVTKATVYNYADDNSLSFFHKSSQILKEVLQDEANIAIKWFKANHMQANPSKFQAFVLGKSDIIKFTILSADNVYIDILCEDTVKMLGVNFDKDFTFNTHVKDICIKAGRQINVLQRLAHLLDNESRMCIMRAFILCHFSYCSLIWHFCGAKNTIKLEKLHLRSLRFVHQDFNSSSELLLATVNTTSLYVQRLKRLILEIFKIIHSMSPVTLSDLYVIRNNTNSRRFLPLEQPRVLTTKYGLNSLTYYGCKLWNDLDNKYKQSSTILQLKSSLARWTGPECKCNLCKSPLLTKI
jgi:hypothetical protein